MNKTTDQNFTLTIGLVLLALSIALAGFMVSSGLKEFRSADRTVNMKGLAQQDVEANFALWTIKHSATGNELSQVQNVVQNNSAKIREFLANNGLSQSDIANRNLEVMDLLAQPYRAQGAENARYIISEVLVLRSDKVDVVDAAYQNTGELLKQNVSLITQQGQSPIEYIYTGLNDIKPEMIAEATKSAREAAKQFASDSGARVGGIKYANQGIFQILPRDSNQSYQERWSRYKTVRVVSTIQFSIVD